MMKKAIIGALAVCGMTFTAPAQAPAGEVAPRERMYVSTDKDNYLSGEIVWMKLITTDEAGVPLVFSKVGYVELVGENESHARERIEITDGAGEGTLVLPSALPTGWYRLSRALSRSSKSTCLTAARAGPKPNEHFNRFAARCNYYIRQRLPRLYGFSRLDSL
jgi:hypothetical protein